MESQEIPEVPPAYTPTYEGWPECRFAIPRIVAFRGSTLENYRHCDNPLANALWKSADQISIEKYGVESHERAKREVEEIAESTKEERMGILGGIIEESDLRHLQYLRETPEEQIRDKETAYKAAVFKFLSSGRANQQYVSLETCQKCPYRIA